MQTLERYSITWVEKTDSTSKCMKSQLEHLPSLCVISAVEQSEGHGSADHLWHSAPGENLTFSILVKYDDNHKIKASSESKVMAAASLAVVDFLSDFGISAVVKLPNDIYVGEKKICGTLIEHSICGTFLKWSIIGIGIDINETDFPEWVPNPVSICQLTGKKYDIKKCLEDFLRHFSPYFDAIWNNPDDLMLRYDGLVSKKLSQRRDPRP